MPSTTTTTQSSSTQKQIGYRDRAGAYYYKKDYARAIADYTKAIQFDSNDALSLYWRGKSKLMNGDYAGGAVDIATAKTINPQVGN